MVHFRLLGMFPSAYFHLSTLESVYFQMLGNTFPTSTMTCIY